MDKKEELEILASAAGILAVVGSIGTWFFNKCSSRRKRTRLEEYLKAELEPARKLGKQGAFSSLHITTKTGLTEAEILQASLGNPRINRLEKLEPDGFTKSILFQYNDQ